MILRPLALGALCKCKIIFLRISYVWVCVSRDKYCTFWSLRQPSVQSMGQAEQTAPKITLCLCSLLSSLWARRQQKTKKSWKFDRRCKFKVFWYGCLYLHKHTEAPSKSFILHPLHFPKKVFSADSKLLMYWWKANYEPSCNCPPHRAIFFILLYLVALSLQLFELFLWIMEEYREKVKTDRLNSNK